MKFKVNIPVLVHSALLQSLSNPHCNPCASMHKRIEKILERDKDISVRYIFNYFNEDLLISNKFLIAAYFECNYDEALEIYGKWFESGKLDKETFFDKYRLNTEDDKIQQELVSHEKWKKQSGLNATPTILLNGYKLPDNYRVEDINYLIE